MIFSPPRTRTAFVFLLLFIPAAPAASAKIAYDVPIEWMRIETHGDYEEAYQTSLDPSKRVFVLIRGVDTGGASAAEWATSQSEAMKRTGVRAGPAFEERFGDADWWYVDWEDPLGNENGRRYFLATGPQVVEVSFLAREDVFKTVDPSRFDIFLASFAT